RRDHRRQLHWLNQPTMPVRPSLDYYTSTAATAIAPSWTRSSAPKTAPNRRLRAKVEHPIGTIKRVLGFPKARYRGLRRNAHRLIVTGARANLSRRVATYCTAGGRRAPAPCQPLARPNEILPPPRPPPPLATG